MYFATCTGNYVHLQQVHVASYSSLRVVSNKSANTSPCIIRFLLGRRLMPCECVSVVFLLEFKRGRSHGLHCQRRSAPRIRQLCVRPSVQSTGRNSCLLLCRLFLGQAFAPAAATPDTVGDEEEYNKKTSSKDVGPATEYFFFVLRLLLCRGLGRVLLLRRG